MKIEVLGPGCARCKKLFDLMREIVELNHFDVELEKVEDVDRMMELGMWATPGIAIDGNVVVCGRVPPADEIKTLIIERL